MSIKGEIDRIKQNVADAFYAIESQTGATVEDPRNSDYLDDNIELYGNVIALDLCTKITVTLDPSEYTIIDVANDRLQPAVLQPSLYYGWKNTSGTIYYTLSATPSVGDELFDSNLQLTTLHITAIYDGYINIG